MKSSPEKDPHLQKDANQLIANISSLMAEAEEMLSESTSQHAEAKVALLRSQDNGTELRLMDRYLSIKSSLASSAKRADQAIRACPYESLAVALGIGLLIGASLGRRRE